MGNIIEKTRYNILFLIEQKLGIIPNWRGYPELRVKYDWLLELEEILPDPEDIDSEVEELESRIEDLEETIESQKEEIEELEDEVRDLETDIEDLKELLDENNIAY